MNNERMKDILIDAIVLTACICIGLGIFPIFAPKEHAKSIAYVFPIQGSKLTSDVKGYPNGLILQIFDKDCSRWIFCENEQEARDEVKRWKATPDSFEFEEGIKLWKSLGN